MMAIASFTVCIQKKKWNLIQKQPSCEKVCSPQKLMVKKPKWQPRNACDGQLLVNFNDNNSGEFGDES